MGRMQADAMSEVADIDTALSWHFSSNHYPPLSPSLIGPAKLAIEAANEGDWDKLIELPDGITFRDGTSAPAGEMVSNFHLDSWIDYEEVY